MGFAAFRVHPGLVSAVIPPIQPLSSAPKQHSDPYDQHNGTIQLAHEPVRPAPTYISAGIKIKGAIRAGEDLFIDGGVQGSVSVPGHRLTVGELAYVEADAVAREVVVYGALQGGVCAFERMEIKRHASVAGDVASATIVIEDGAHFKGVISADSTVGIKT